MIIEKDSNELLEFTLNRKCALNLNWLRESIQNFKDNHDIESFIANHVDEYFDKQVKDEDSKTEEISFNLEGKFKNELKLLMESKIMNGKERQNSSVASKACSIS